MVGAVTWEIETLVRQAQDTDPDPGTGLPGWLFVPTFVRARVIQWAHTARFTDHPGVQRTITFLQRYFWWPTLEKDARVYVTACTTCARGKRPNRPPSGLLQPLPTPGRPWSHIALDFITGLPPSLGNSTILTIVDHFSKAVHFVALPKLLSALETAQLLTTHIFRLHGIPADIVSEDHSSPPECGRNSAHGLAQRLVSPLAFIHRAMAKQREQTRNSKRPCGA